MQHFIELNFIATQKEALLKWFIPNQIAPTLLHIMAKVCRVMTMTVCCSESIINKVDENHWSKYHYWFSLLPIRQKHPFLYQKSNLEILLLLYNCKIFLWMHEVTYLCEPSFTFVGVKLINLTEITILCLS